MTTNLRLDRVTNGNNHCWLNASLFAFLYHPFVLRSTMIRRPTRWLRALRTAGDAKTWDASLYEKLRTTLSEEVSCADELPRPGVPGNPVLVFEASKQAIAPSTQPGADDALLWEGFLAARFGDLRQRLNCRTVNVYKGATTHKHKVLVSVVVSERPLARSHVHPGNEEIDFHHWIAYARVGAEVFVKWDAQHGGIQRGDDLRVHLDTTPPGHVHSCIAVYMSPEMPELQEFVSQLVPLRYHAEDTSICRASKPSPGRYELASRSSRADLARCHRRMLEQSSKKGC